MTNEEKSGIRLGLALAIAGLALAWLLGLATTNEQHQMDALAELHAKELATCWQSIEDGQVCKIEYIRDRTDTVIGAKVVKED